MRKIISMLLGIFFLVTVIVLPANIIKAEAMTIKAEMRAVWVPTVLNLAYPSKATSDAVTLKKEALTILDNAKDMGFNTVFFQVRPAADALYPSKIFPWSQYLTGIQGKAPDDNFDPLAFMIKEAHARGLELHAWINPYRVTANKNDNAKLAANNPALINPEITITHTDGKIYFNPGEPEARALIIAGIKEIIDNYAVDGIHLDDYFYPSTNFADAATYAKYGTGYTSIGDWRRNNNDILIKEIKLLIDKKNAKLVFGVSPFGIWANEKSNVLGSNTTGKEAYYSEYADTRKWVKEEYLDYIIPQIYWEVGNIAADYSELVNWWTDVVQETSVKLYIGLGAYKTIGASVDSPWYQGKEIERQIIGSRENPSIRGFSIYSYQTLVQNDFLYKIMVKFNDSQAVAFPTRAKIVVDEKTIPFGAYNINGSNFFKLRDLAYVLNASSKSFAVSWNSEVNAINATKNKPYILQGGEMIIGKNSSTVATRSLADLYIDGKKVRVTAYNIFGNNYFKLRDLSLLLGFVVSWDQASASIIISTK
ncbi:MAG: family 10 glycosylhydrolase [Clostridia bacterium]